jgi:hypothetical protein
MPVHTKSSSSRRTHPANLAAESAPAGTVGKHRAGRGRTKRSKKVRKASPPSRINEKYMHTDGAPAWRAINLRGKWSQEQLSQTDNASDERMRIKLRRGGCG